MKSYFLKKKWIQKKQPISTLMSTQLLSQKQSLPKELNPYCEEFENNIEKNIVHNTGNQKPYTDIPSSSTTENTIQWKNVQNIEKKRNTQNETTNTINLSPSSIIK